MNFQDIFFVSIIGYIVGSIQPSYFIGKMKGTDIREHGSKNAGAANTTMTLGWAFGIFTGVFDVLKATFCVIITAYIFESPNFSFLPFLSGAMAIIGHNYPLYMGFDGGKGTASVIGIMFGFDFIWGLVMLAVIISSTLITNYLVVGTINIYLVLMYLAIFKYTSPEILYVSLFLSILGIYKHRQNIVRIKNRTEPTFRSTL